MQIKDLVVFLSLHLLAIIPILIIMLQLHTQVWRLTPRHSQLGLLGACKAYLSNPSGSEDTKDLDAARKWFAAFNKTTIPESIAKTEYVKASGSGGQKTNK